MRSKTSRDPGLGAPPPPRTFLEYLRSFGPGLIVVLTWLGAGDIVETGVAGGNYGYSLMWIIVLALLMRFLFVSLIAKYQLCNQHGESVLDGLARLHPWYPPALALAALIFGHAVGSYMAVGIGETWRNLTGCGQTWHWALLWSAIGVVLVFRPVYARIELLFKGLLVLLSISILGTAIWVGPSIPGILRGTVAFELPEREGSFDALLLCMGMLGAVGGSLMNLVYPYFLEQKGWRGPQYRRVQLYDLLLGIVVMIVLDLAVWTLAAELVHQRGEQINDLPGLTRLLGLVLGSGGQLLFYVGIFAVVFTSQLGNALGLGCLASHGYLRWRRHSACPANDYRTHPVYKITVLWVLLSPLVWTLPGMPDFVTLTIVVNSMQVVLIPFLAGGLWWITARTEYIGSRYRNRWWENMVMLVLFALSLWGAYGSVQSVAKAVRELF